MYGKNGVTLEARSSIKTTYKVKQEEKGGWIQLF